MSKKFKKRRDKFFLPIIFTASVCALGAYFISRSDFFTVKYAVLSSAEDAIPPAPAIDVFAYNKKMIALANFGTTTAATGIMATSSAWFATSTSISSPKNPWPVKTAYPKFGAILPFSRVVAYYGNFYSKQMGILGQYPPEEMLQRLQEVVLEWQAADPETPVIPALDYIAVTAQLSAGTDGKYRLRMPADQIKKAISLADQIKGLVFLDVQVGLSNLQSELPLLEEYLKMPEVELAVDPEFSMKTGKRPGTVIGSMDAEDINFAANYLAKIVKANNLPPKILLVHRFTEDMVTNYEKIVPLPEVEIVMSMDGWGEPEKKIKVFSDIIKKEPVQFAGLKIFYKNDTFPPSRGLLTNNQILNLKPQPIFVEYQ